MRTHTADVAKLARLQDEFDAEGAKVFNPNGGRNREALLRLSEIASELARFHDEAARQMARVANDAYDLASTT
ncbi:hypothetical protein ABZU76_47270 [Amycolatopsis sp. NPDC005232]|uniref:hypothetical protein n=1 Tax=Amycolatopsis sp. NPDC005232 TaxID=3157027 RepID=UPI0033B1A7B3